MSEDELVEGLARNFVVDSTKVAKIQIRLFFGPDLDGEFRDLDVAYVKLKGGFVENYENGSSGLDDFKFLDSVKDTQRVTLKNVSHKYFGFNFPQTQAPSHIQQNYRYLANFISGTSKAKVLFKANCGMDYDWVSSFITQTQPTLDLRPLTTSPAKNFLITQQFLFSSPNWNFNKSLGFSSSTSTSSPDVYWQMLKKNRQVFS
jgi:hypothetical protein